MTAPHVTSPGLIGRREVARRLGVHPNTVRALVDRGELTLAARIGPRGDWRFDPAEVTAYIARSAA